MKIKFGNIIKRASVLALFATVALGMSQPITAKAWEYSNPSYPNGYENDTVKSYEFSNKVKEGWTMVDYAKASSNWAVSPDGDAITPDSSTDYWSENPVVYKNGLGSKIYFADNRNLGIQVNTGTHSYPYVMQAGEEMPVWYWVAAGNPLASHNANPGIPEGTDVYNYKGFLFRMNQNERGLPKSPCERNGDSTAWHPVCAICGQEINFNTYASAQAVADMPSLTMKDASFLYSCRVCGGMEQGSGYSHICKKISTNKYNIHYSKNTKDPYCSGSVSSQVVYYKQDGTTGKAQFDGKDVTGDLIARTNAFVRPGYEFVGWNTKPDGSGVAIAYGQSLEYFYNNTDTERNVEGIASSKNENAGVYDITLYAQWKANTSYLKIDANAGAYNGGATYNGQSVWTSSATTYHVLSSADGSDKGSANDFKKSTYVLNESLINVPSGYTGTFMANGTESKKITATTYFAGYSVNGDFNGFFDNATKTYIYGPENRTVENADTITLAYMQNDIKLPEAPDNASQSFVGWYTDSDFKNYAGTTGDSYTLTGNTTFYARYSTLEVDVTDVYYKTDTSTNSYTNVARDAYGKARNDYSTPNSSYAVQNATGAVNLSMQMFTPNSWHTVYKPQWKYPWEDDSAWKYFDTTNGANSSQSSGAYDATINFGDDTVANGLYVKTNTSTYTYTVQSSGLYKLDAFGAQGGNYSTYKGGLGGEAYGTFYLKEGDVLTITVGGQNGTNGGGAMSAGGFSCGGGYTKITSAQLGTLLIAGGGGGATSKGNGGAGGSSTKNITGNNGEAGMAGGGGGYTGGQKGEVIYHKHTGSSSSGGGCYGRYIAGHTHTDDCHEYECSSNPSSCRCNNCGAWGGHWMWSHGCGNCGSSDISNEDCGPWGDITCGKAEVSSHYELTCNKTENVTIESSKPAYGGSNYINTTAVQASTYIANGLSGKQTGHGKVTITGVMLNLKDGSDNKAEILGAKFPDWSAPSSVGELQTNASSGAQIVSWSKPASNGVPYDFRVEMYELPATGDTLTLKQTSDKVTRTIESAIAGYYYIYDDSSTTNVSDYVYNKYDKPAYTWNDQHYSDENTGFTQSTSLSVNTTYNYVHVAAVDVAGNIGPSSHKEVAKTNLCLITFDTNHLDYQLSPGSSVNNGSWNATGKTTNLPAPGANVQNGFYRGYYSVDGTDQSGTRGTFDGSHVGTSYGGAFPIPTATGCTFVGWNSKADGTGIYYSADGSNIGLSDTADEKLILSNLTGSHTAGQTITLYAIWTDNTTISVPSKTYTKTTWKAENGTITKTESTVTTSEKAGVWSNNVYVRTNGQSQATGAWKLWQYCASADNKAVVNYYPGGAPDNNTYAYEVNHHSTNTETAMYSGTSATVPDTAFHSTPQYLNVTYNLQGTYNVSGKAESRTASEVKNVSTKHGSGCTVSSDYTVIKLDKTIPSIYDYRIKQTTLNDFSANDSNGNGIPDIEEAIQSGNMLTKFEVWVSDYNNAANGDFVSMSDASGIAGVYLYVFDAYNYDTSKVYTLPEVQRITTNKEGLAAIDAKYSISINLYADFPDTDKLKFIIFAADKAGNISNLNDKIYHKESGEIGTPDGPVQEPDENNAVPDDSWIVGELTNFSVKAVAYNDEDEAYNVNPDSGEIYFQVGEIGHLDVWTVGYVENLNFDFGPLGDEAEATVKKGNMLEKYILDTKTTVDNVTSERTIPHTVGDQILVNSFCVIDEETGNAVNATAGGSRTIKYNGASISESTLVNQLNTKDGIAYAKHYTASMNHQKWWDEGTSIRIPTNYQMVKTGEVDKYGTPIYQNENHEFAVIANKNDTSTISTNSFILWDMASNDVHYRVIHEN